MIRRQCCSSYETEQHTLECPMIASINARFARDMSGETFIDSYINHSATAVRKRALAAQNGGAGYYETYRV